MSNEVLPFDSIEEPDNCMRIVFPTFDRIRDTMRRKIIAHMWVNVRVDRCREGFRPSFSDLYGEGADFTMPLAASWLSSGPDAHTDETNIIAFPKGIDKSAVAYMRDIGMLGKHAFTDFKKLPDLAKRHKRLLYNVDELPEKWDPISANSARTMRLVNTKKELYSLSGSAVPFLRASLRELYRDLTSGFGKFGTIKSIPEFLWGRFHRHFHTSPDTTPLYIKLNNTEASGIGVFKCDSPGLFQEHIQRLYGEAWIEDLDDEIVIQPHVDGKNRNFQYILDPGFPNRLQLLTLSEQHVADDGVTYLSSLNAPIHREHVSPRLAALMTDMARRIQTVDLNAFGCVMCDYFELPNGDLQTFDPGLRPTGNTATAVARLFVQEQTGTPMYSSLFSVHSHKPQTAFKNYIQPIDALMGPDAAARDKNCILPWGYNHIGGNGLFIAVSSTQDELRSIMEEAERTLTAP